MPTAAAVKKAPAKKPATKKPAAVLVPVIDERTSDIYTLTRTLVGESAKNVYQDAYAIACVILNRKKFPGKWPSSISKICTQPLQFSCWNRNDPQYERIQAMNDNNGGEWWETCKVIAATAVDGKLKDVTNRSTHYYASYIDNPPWFKGQTPAYEVDHGYDVKYVGKKLKGKKVRSAHFFFNNIDTPEPLNYRQALAQAAPLWNSRNIQLGLTAATASGGGAYISKQKVEEKKELEQKNEKLIEKVQEVTDEVKPSVAKKLNTAIEQADPAITLAERTQFFAWDYAIPAIFGLVAVIALAIVGHRIYERVKGIK